MSRFHQIVALTLLALWVPATGHCDLEALGIMPTHELHEDDPDCREVGDPCSHDGCEVVEQDGYSLTKHSARVPAPLLILCDCLICLVPSGDEPADLIATHDVAVDRPIDWVPIWHFERRDAPPARAPDYTV